MSNKPQKPKTNITKISAQSTPKPVTQSQPIDTKNQKPTKTKTKKSSEQSEKPLKEVFILARPFVALGRYLRDSWREIRQVRWPGRKATWKMTLAVLIYCVIFMVFILVLDALFTFIFDLLLGTN